jgi:hypothetical protein
MTTATPRGLGAKDVAPLRRIMLTALCDRVTKQTGCYWLPEFRFSDTRRWRFDAAFPEKKVALEVDGAIWTQGRHTRGAGYLKDLEKFANAAVLGWRVIRVPWDWIEDGTAEEYLVAAMEGQ